MAKQWTPPSDAAVTENNKFVPPSDAAEVKKKEVSQSTLNQSNTSSARLNKTTTKPTVSSSLKDNGQYTFPGQEGVSFKKEGNNWYRREKDSYEYKQIKEPARINNLEKRALSEEKYSFETAPAPKQEKAKFQAAPKAAPAKPVTQTEKAAQKAFTEEFKPLALDSPEYLKRKKESDLIESKVGQITPDLINDNEGDVVPRIKDLIKDYPYLSVSESGIGYDELEIVNNATGEREKINLENWTSDRDQKEAKRLQGFLDIQMNSKDYVDQYKKVNYIKDQMSDATPTDRIKLSEQLLEEQGKLNELKTSRYLKAGDDQYKLAALYDKNAKENIKTDFAKLQIQTIDYSEKVKSYSDWTEKINEARKAGKITDEQYQAEYAPKLAEEKRMLIEEKDKISKDFAQTRSESDSIDNIAANQYAIESERGNILTGASFSALQGAENSLRFLLETGDFQDGEFKGLLTEAAPGSISETYTSAEGRNSLEQIVFGLANSGGSALVGAAIGSPFLGLYASSYVNMKDQMSSPAFKDVPEWQKILMSGVYGGTVGVLEKYGVSKWFQKTPAGKGLTNWILKKTISELGEDASSEAIELAIKKNLNAAVANGLIQITSAGLVEGSTELAQEGADMIYKDVFNKLSEKKYFENPKSWAGVADRLSQSFILGFAGGAGMNSISQATEIGRNELTKAQIDNITQFINDPELQDTFKMNLKDQILSGQITKDDAKRQVERLNELEGTIKKIPENVDRYQAFKLLNERDDIQKEIAGKDPALVAAQTERINAINEELKTISQNAVQEQTTSEVFVQPGAEVGGEMAQGESQAGSQVATEEGTITEEEKVTPAPETDQVATYRAEEQSELLKAIPKIESYKVNGEIDKTLMPKTVLAKYNKIYEKYDKLISPLLETTEQPSNNLVTEDNINDVIQRQTTPVQQKLAKSAKLVMKALPGSKIFLHETQEDFDNAIGEKTNGTERGAFIPSDGSIHINMQVALPHTLLHEAFHAVVLSKKLDNNTLNAWTKGLKGIVKDKALLDRLNNLTELYSAEEQSEEFISELGSIMGEAQKTLSTSGFQKFKVLINKIAAKAGLPPIFTAASTAQDAVDFINTISGKLTRGEEIYVNDPGDGGEVGTFNIPDAKFQKAKSVADDPRDFIRELVQDVDLREFNGQKFITNMYDYTNAGKTDLGNGFSIDMLGGKNYVPLMMSLNGKGIGDVSNLAAFNTKEQAETFIRNSEKGGAKLFAPHAGTLDNSWQFQQHTFAELFNLVLDAGILTPNELIAVFNNTIKDSKANQAQFQQFANRYGEDIKSFDSFESDPKKIVDLLDIKNNYSPKLRKALNNAIASNKKFQQAIGVNNKNEFYQRIMDPLNQGMTGGEIMNIVEFDPNTFEIVETKPNNADHHPSFGFALLAKINGIYQPTQLFKSVDVTESYTKYNKGGEEVSRKADEPKFEEKNVSSSAGAIPKTAEFIESMPAKTSKRKKQIIGKSAELSDNTRRNLELAKAIEMTGADQNTIFVETGWFRGTDGKWKYEVPDELTFMRFAMSDLKPKLKDGYMAEVGANQIIGKNLLLAYPQLSDITFEFTKGEGRNYYNPIDNVIRLSIDETNDEIYSTYVHEVQHAIQYIENFAKGGGKETAAKTEKGKAAAKRLKKATVVAGNKNPLLYDKGIKSGADYVSLLQEELLVNNSMSWRKENGYFEKGVSVVDLIKKFIKSDKETLLQDKNSVLELLDASVYHHEVTGLRGYLKLAGEVESRNIETRLKMGQEERKSTVPNSTEDVAAEDQILYFDFDTMKSERKKQLVAPNGKPSNLNDKQWEQVRTPAFKKWFGDWENDPKNASKVVDENGEPKVVYHGSMSEFDEFKKEELGKATGSESSMLGFYFSDNKEVSETYIGPAMNQLEPNLDGLQSALDKMTKKQLGQFDVDVLNYADSSDNYSDTEEDLEYFRDDLFSAVRQDTESYIFDSRRLIEKAEKFIRSNNIDPDFRAYPEGYIYPTFINIRNPYIKDYKGDLWEYTPEFDNISKNNDGAILENTLDSVPTDERDGGIESNVFIVFEPNQIKSATENVGTFSAETPKIKFQKNEAIQKAKEKYDLSVKERGNTKEQGINSALEDLRKSDWYNKADDIQREEAERELKKFFGQKIKSAPSINKITGAKPTKIQVDEAAALKSQLRLEARAARDAKTDLNTKRKQIAAFIRSLETKGTITARQASALVKRASSLNLDNPVMIVRFENYAEKIFQRAEYQDLLTSAFKVRRLIRKAIKSENQAEVVGMAKLFSQIDPSLVDDIDNYIEIAGNVLNAVRPSKEKGMDVALRQAANIEIVSEYANEEIAKQEENRKRELMSEYKYLVDSGVLTEDLSVKEMQEIINLIDNPNAEFDPEADQKKLKFLQNRLASMEAVFRYMTANNINPFTGEEVVIEAKDADLIKRLLKMDLTEMSVKDAAKVVEAMDNYLMNNITSGLEAAVRSYEGAQNAKQLVAQGKKARPLRSYFNKTIGRFFGEQMISLPLLFEKMFPGIKNSANIMQKMGLVDVINGSNKAIRQQNDLMTEYSKEDFYKEDGFMEAKNVYERGMLAFLKRNLTGTKTEIRDEFKRRAEIIKQSIEALRENGTDKEIEMADLYQEIYDKLGVAELDLDVIEARSSKMNKDAVAWMVNQWGKYYGELADVSLSVYNSMLGSDTNYTPDRYKSLSAEDQGLDEALLNSGSGFMMSMDYTDKNKTGVLMEATRPKVLPKGRYISLDFDVNNFNSLKGALVDINTAAAIRQIDGFTKSKSFSKLIPDANDRKILTKRINTYIQRAKGKRTVTSDTMKDVERLANFISGLGVGKALAGLDQPIKQTVPVMINTMINSGGTMTFVNTDMNEAINRSGMPIANRGLEAQTTVESIDRLLDKKGGFGAEAIKKLEDLNQFWLKTLLAKPDVWVARSSFITYYLKDMKSKGENVKDIDWSKHEWNQDSAEYAQLMVDRQQNISDDKLAGEFLSSDDSTRRIARKVIMPFATFIMNQKARMHNDFLALRSKDTSVEDRKSAIKSLTGLGAELFAYQLIAYGVKTLIYDNIANYLVGDDDEEEKKDKSLFGLKMTAKQYSATKFPVKSIVGDILSPLPIFDDLITMGFDKAMESFPQISNEDIKKSVDEKNTILRLQGKDEMDDNAKAKFIEQLKADNIYSVAFKNDSQAGRAYGMIGIAYDTYKELIDLSRMAYTGEFEDEYQGRVTNKYLPEEDRKILQNISVPLMIAYSTGLLPKDLGTVARKVTNIVKKKGVTENQHEKEKEVKKQINRDLSSWEFELVKTRKKANGVVDEINYVESKGGLNDKQGKEYVKLMDAFPAPSDDMLIDIQKGMTADQIIKKNKG